MATKLDATEKSELHKVNVHLCPKYEKAASILGKRWTGLILYALMDGPFRFNELLSIVKRSNEPFNMAKPVSDRLLTERLRELEKEGLVERIVYPESPVRIEYKLTPKGMSMRTVVDAIQQWAEEWIPLDSVTDSED
ncbi:MAG TPA: helix-turn-helix domain-containing protein [Chloroflexia bacterium]|nr:helix-turn-helix domain-containing protein [Chloroflexia bacterium]